MKLIFSPSRMDETLTATRTGDVLTLNGEELDFGPLPDGATLPREAIDSPWIAGDVTRENGVLTVPVVLPHGANAPEATRFPEQITLTGDGPVSLPLYDVEPEPEAEA